MGCRSRRRTAALRTRAPPARGGGPRLAPLPPATRIMALRVSYLPPYAPCVTAASGLCLPFPTPKPHGGGRRPLGGAPRTPAAAPPDGRVVGPAGAWYEPPPPSIRLPRPVTPPLIPPCPPSRLALVALYGQCGPPGERRRPALPRAPPPTTAGAKGQPAPGGLLCRGGEATGQFVPARNGGVYPRHRAQTPVGG